MSPAGNMSNTVIDTTEVQRVVHAAIVSWGASVADSTIPEGGSEPNFDRLEEIAKILRACLATGDIGHLGEPYSPPDFSEMNLRTPRLFDALRDIVAKWSEWCDEYVSSIGDPDSGEAYVTYWTGQAEAAQRVLVHIDGEDVKGR